MSFCCCSGVPTKASPFQSGIAQFRSQFRSGDTWLLNIYVGNPDVNFAMFIRANLILVRTFCITAVLLHILQLPLIHDTMRVNMTVYTARITLRLVRMVWPWGLV